MKKQNDHSVSLAQRKNQNSKFELWLLPKAYGFCTIENCQTIINWELSLFVFCKYHHASHL